MTAQQQKQQHQLKKKILRLFAIGASLLFVLFYFYSYFLSEKNEISKSEVSPPQNGAVPQRAAAHKNLVLHKNLAPANKPASVASLLKDGASGNSPAPEKLQQFLKQLDPQAAWFLRQKDDGQLTSISGGAISGPWSDPAEVLKLAQKLAPLIGVDPEQLHLASKNLPSSAGSTSVQIQQSIAGHPVFGGIMDLFIRDSDQKIYFITSKLFSLTPENVQAEVQSDYLQAQKAALALFSNQAKKWLENPTSLAVIFPISILRGELCWQVELHVAQPRLETHLLFLSTLDLHLVRDLNLSVRN